MGRPTVTPRPFLKWVGGKGQLLPELLKAVEAAGAFGKYHEPFVGGGALFFELSRLGRMKGRKAFLSDNNAGLIEAYKGVQENAEAIIALLHGHKEKHCEAYFYAMRADVPSDAIARAARVIYLNKTCFNGLYRENSKGLFNTPFGRYKNPLICDEENLRAVAAALKDARIEQRPFETVIARAAKGDFVYFDPPYHPVSKTASFTSYDKGGFGEDQQRRLAEVFAELDRRGVKALLSNSKTPFIEELYRAFTLREVFATRAINSKADRRGAVSEVLVSNFM
ncbi:MAG TPA: DNA adenine methylase [Candidatus Hydrogenedentes bacterium]|nr:DNA adenine methylase [Candidatus Hydrogenedentota bacterium]